MSNGQARYWDNGAPLSTKTMRPYQQAVTAIGVYAGFDVSATGPEQLAVDAGFLVFPTGIGFSAPAQPSVQFLNPVVPTTFTLAWTHDPGNFQGPVDAQLQLFGTKMLTVPNGVPIAYITHPGTGTLTQAMITPVGKVSVPAVVLDQIDRRPWTLLPPFPGAIVAAVPGEATVPGQTSPNEDVTYTTQNPAVTPTVQHVAAGLSTPLSVGVVGTAITVNLATNAGGAPISTGAQVVAAILATAGARALVQPRINGTGLGLAAPSAVIPISGGNVNPAQGPDVTVSVNYARAFQRAAYTVMVGSAAPGTEQLCVLFPIAASSLPPVQFILSLLNSTGSLVSLSLIDTAGNTIALAPNNVGPTSGWTDIAVSVARGGTFTPGGTYFLEVLFSGPANTSMALSKLVIISDGPSVA